MRVTLHNEEINQALKAYISSAGISLSGKDVEINIIAGRGTNGTSAEMDINSMSTKKTVSAVPRARTKPKEDLSIVEAESKPEAIVQDAPPSKAEESSKVEQEVAEEVPVTSKSLFA